MVVVPSHPGYISDRTRYSRSEPTFDDEYRKRMAERRWKRRQKQEEFSETQSPDKKGGAKKQ